MDATVVYLQRCNVMCCVVLLYVLNDAWVKGKEKKGKERRRELRCNVICNITDRATILTVIRRDDALHCTRLRVHEHEHEVRTCVSVI